MRAVLVAAALAVGCSPAHAPKAKSAGKVMSLTGVGGLIAIAFAAHYTGESTSEIVIGFSTLSAIGIGTYAVGDLSTPAPIGYSETTSERHQRWARVLTERAYGYARDGRCHRVRHIEPRVRIYDREFHDFVFMKDPAIVKCLDLPAPEPTPPSPDDSETPIESP